MVSVGFVPRVSYRPVCSGYSHEIRHLISCKGPSCIILYDHQFLNRRLFQAGLRPQATVLAPTPRSSPGVQHRALMPGGCVQAWSFPASQEHGQFFGQVSCSVRRSLERIRRIGIFLLTKHATSDIRLRTDGLLLIAGS